MRSINALALVLMVSLAACTSRPIRNVDNDPVVTSGKPATMAGVEQAIVRAGKGLGWVMTPVKPGELSGRLSLREHVAVVDITYDTKRFSIKYKDSENLDHAGDNIHRNYNGWIENLEREIRANLQRM
ncbi:MAG: hypothetical protein ABI294_08580 [Casimicrobiaceae bacterium]